jgi:hypothetical protein
MAEPTMERDQEVVKRSGRDEPAWVVLHMCMEAMLGISLYRYLYLKLAKKICLSYYLLCFLFNKIREEGGTGSARKWGGVGWGCVWGWTTVYPRVSKGKTDKKKKKKICLIKLV